MTPCIGRHQDHPLSAGIGHFDFLRPISRPQAKDEAVGHRGLRRGDGVGAIFRPIARLEHPQFVGPGRDSGPMSREADPTKSPICTSATCARRGRADCPAFGHWHFDVSAILLAQHNFVFGDGNDRTNHPARRFWHDPGSGWLCGLAGGRHAEGSKPQALQPAGSAGARSKGLRAWVHSVWSGNAIPAASSARLGGRHDACYLSPRLRIGIHARVQAGRLRDVLTPASRARMTG